MLYGIGYTTVPVEKGPLFHARNTMVEAPSNYKDPMKIKEYIDKIKEKRKEEAYYSHMMCRLGKVAIHYRGGLVVSTTNTSLLKDLLDIPRNLGDFEPEYAVANESLFMNLLILDHLAHGLTFDKTHCWLFQSRFGQNLFPSDEGPDFILFDPFLALTRTGVFSECPAAVAAEFGFKDDPKDAEEVRMAKMAYYLGSVMGRDAN